MRINKDFEELLALFDVERVRALIVGGYAVAFHGRPRATKDIDVWVRADAENASRVMKAITAFGFGDVGLSAADFEHPGQIIQLGYPPNRIDLITGVEALDFDEAYARRVEASFGSAAVAYLSRDDLIRSKEAVGRAVDRDDARFLRRVAKKQAR